MLTALGAFTAIFDTGAELNKTHVWNELIEPHARLHIAWQLASNALVFALAMWLLWRDQPPGMLRVSVRTAAALLLVEPLGFLAAAAGATLYEGTFFPSNVPEYDIKLGVVPIALAVYLALAAAYLSLLLLDRDKPHVS